MENAQKEQDTRRKSIIDTYNREIEKIKREIKQKDAQLETQNNIIKSYESKYYANEGKGGISSHNTIQTITDETPSKPYELSHTERAYLLTQNPN